MSAALFGTDGIRGRAGAHPLDPATVARIGAAIAGLAERPRVLIGRDPRESGPAIERQLAAGMGSRALAFSAGVVPTPGLAYLTRALGFDLGVMVSASHNPWQDNGIKVFDAGGRKLSARLEARIGREVLARGAVPRSRRAPAPVDAAPYLDFLARQGEGLAAPRPLRLAVDCANGAASRWAPALFRRLGLPAAVGHARPDGRNINAGCGSTAPAALQRLVGRHRAGLGLALDGDADRAVFCDAGGGLLEGDHVLYLLALYLRECEPRFRPLVVGTVMSNLGLELALRRAGIGFQRADVGDKHVLRRMVRCGAILGGEPSGHVILRHRHSSGDGLLTALFVLRALRHFAWDAAELGRRLRLLPQRTLSIRVRRKPALSRWPAFQAEAARFARAHGDRARLLVRYSGTEPKLRVMIEARDPGTIEASLPVFQSLVENEIGE
jgi:phosphoglucosamine mutase